MLGPRAWFLSVHDRLNHDSDLEEIAADADLSCMKKTILFLLLSPWIPAPGSTIDPQTGLHTRIVHRESGIVLVLIPAGKFQMGSPESEPDRVGGERQHLRIIREPFYMAETEVTVAQFRRFVNATKFVTDAERGVEEHGHFKGAFATVADGEREWSEVASWRNPFPNFKEYHLLDNHPVVQVSWNDARRFVEHFGLQLPTEAQWEYAMRAGSATRYLWGDSEAAGKGYGNVKDAASRNVLSGGTHRFRLTTGVRLLMSSAITNQTHGSCATWWAMCRSGVRTNIVVIIRPTVPTNRQLKTVQDA